MKSILSTRVLAPHQLKSLLDSGFSVTQENFIRVQPKEFRWDTLGNILLFTSQNAVKSVLLHPDVALLKEIPCVCVGEKTAELLRQNNWKVLHFEGYADALGSYIKQHHSHDTFTFFSGNLRRNVLPQAMQEKDIAFNEIEVYETVLHPHKIDKPHTGILFFSPSGVKSFMKNNLISDEICFGIGSTTADEVLKYVPDCVISDKPTTDSLILKCIEVLG